MKRLLAKNTMMNWWPLKSMWPDERGRVACTLIQYCTTLCPTAVCLRSHPPKRQVQLQHPPQISPKKWLRSPTGHWPRRSGQATGKYIDSSGLKVRQKSRLTDLTAFLSIRSNHIAPAPFTATNAASMTSIVRWRTQFTAKTSWGEAWSKNRATGEFCGGPPRIKRKTPFLGSSTTRPSLLMTAWKQNGSISWFRDNGLHPMQPSWIQKDPMEMSLQQEDVRKQGRMNEWMNDQPGESRCSDCFKMKFICYLAAIGSSSITRYLINI